MTASTSQTVVAGPSDPPGGSGIAGVQCSLDAAAFTICPPTVTYQNLAEGHHVAAARARDRAGNVDPTPAEYEWTIDLTAPTAAFLSTPRTLTSLQTAGFTFEAVNAGPAPNESFLCKLDDDVDFTPCTSPASFDGLAKEASHTLWSPQSTRSATSRPSRASTPGRSQTSRERSTTSSRRSSTRPSTSTCSPTTSIRRRAS